MRRTLLGYLWVSLAATSWGCWSLFFRPAGLPSGWIAFGVQLAMALLGLALLVRPASRRAPDGAPARTWDDWRWMVLFGLGDAANQVLFFGALTRTTVAVATLSHYLAPALVALFAPLLLRTRLRRGALLEALVATIGLLWLLEPWRGAALGRDQIVGAAMGAGSAVFYAMDLCAQKRMTGRFTPSEQLAYHSLIALPVVAFLVPWHTLPSLRSATLVLLAGLLLGGLGTIVFVRGLARVPAARAAVLTFLEPLTAVLVGALVFGERLSALALGGAVLVLGAGVRAVTD